MSEGIAPINRLGHAVSQPVAAPGWSASPLVRSGALVGANGLRMGPDGRLYVAQAFGSQISAVDLATGLAEVVSGAGGAIVAPDDLAFDSHGTLFATEVMSARVSARRSNGAVDVIASDVPVANGITIHGDRIFMSEFNPDGRIWELFADGAQPRLIASGLMMPNALCMGPDGCLYFPLVPLGEVWRVNVSGGAPERVVGGLDIPTAVKFDGQGQLFAVESGSGAITRIDLATGTAHRFARVAYGIDNLAFGPDGRMFVSHFTDGEISQVMPDGTVSVLVEGGLCGPYGLCVDSAGGLAVADGMSLASVRKEGGVQRPAMLLQHGFPGYVRGVGLTDCGDFVVTNSAGQCARYSPGGEARILAEGLDQAMGLAMVKDTVFICEAGAGNILAVDGQGEVRTVCGGLERPVGIAPSSSGGLFVSESAIGRLVHIDSGDVQTVLSGLDDPHGVATSIRRGGSDLVYVLDRGSGALHRIDGANSHIVASGLPVGSNQGACLPALPGIEDLMPGPLLPFSDIAVLADGSVAVGADQTGEIIRLATN